MSRVYNGLEINLQKSISFTYYLLGESLQNCTPNLYIQKNNIYMIVMDDSCEWGGKQTLKWWKIIFNELLYIYGNKFY